MNRSQIIRTMQAYPKWVWGVLSFATVVSLQAQTPHLTVPVTGGMPGLPLMTGIERVGTNQVTVHWDGPAGLYRLMRKMEITDAGWQQIVGWNTNWSAEVPALQEQEFFRVIGPSPNYAGSSSCAVCHAGVHKTEKDTRHADALETLKRIGQGNNPSCLPCHTVGYQLPTGFTTELATPNLAGVQCENCHGPAGLHVADPYDPYVKPRVEIAGQMCGGCHTGSHHPTYDEWSLSGHAEVLEELKEDFEGSRGESFYIPNCGGCHSGSVRQAYLDDEPLPDGHDASAIGIVCVTCHDPHQNHVWTNVISAVVTTNQLLYPTASLEDHHTSGSWATNYNPNINVCAQCHNDRGASWTSTSRPPHHSPQYNMLLATVGELPDGVTPWAATHMGSRFFTNSLNTVIAVTNQCVSCHMQTEEHQNGPPEVAANTGHTFRVDSYGACLGCHQPLLDPDRGEEVMQDFVDFVTMVVDSEIDYTKTLLDFWGAELSPAILRTNYGALAWEYTNGGDLSDGDGPPGGPEGQDQIPCSIKKARFNLYVVAYDGSLGVHNTFYALDLLTAAQDWVLYGDACDDEE